MTITSVYSVIGDSNIRRNMTSMNVASRQVMAECEVIDCPPLSNLEDAFASVRKESTVCIFQASTQLLVAAADVGTFLSTIETLLHELAAKVTVFCRARSSMMIMVCPPMYRPWPLWYRHHLPEVASTFSQVFSRIDLPNILMLPSFINQEILVDGIHLTPVAGLHYLLHMFDESEKALKSRTLSSDEKVTSVVESSRSNLDRIVLMEHDHARLVEQVDLKVASDSEFNDWLTNRADEDWLTISGLPRLSVTGKPWQAEVKKQVRGALLEVVKTFRLSVRFEVLHVFNPIKNRPGQTCRNF